MRFPLVSFFAVSLFGCLAPVTGAARLSHAPLGLAPRTTTARVVFFRPEHLIGSAITPVVFDGVRRQVVGKSINGTAFAVDLDAGSYRFCATSVPEQSARMFPDDTVAYSGFTAPVTRLSLDEGTTTLVRVDVFWESFGRPRVALVPLRKGSPAEARALASLETSRVVELDSASPEFLELAEADLLTRRFDACLDSTALAN